MSGLVSGFGVNKYPKGINRNHNLWLLSIFLLTDNVASKGSKSSEVFFIPPSQNWSKQQQMFYFSSLICFWEITNLFQAGKPRIRT